MKNWGQEHVWGRVSRDRPRLWCQSARQNNWLTKQHRSWRPRTSSKWTHCLMLSAYSSREHVKFPLRWIAEPSGLSPALCRGTVVNLEAASFSSNGLGSWQRAYIQWSQGVLLFLPMSSRLIISCMNWPLLGYNSIRPNTVQGLWNVSLVQPSFNTIYFPGEAKDGDSRT